MRRTSKVKKAYDEWFESVKSGLSEEDYRLLSGSGEVRGMFGTGYLPEVDDYVVDDDPLEPNFTSLGWGMDGESCYDPPENMDDWGPEHYEEFGLEYYEE